MSGRGQTMENTIQATFGSDLRKAREQRRMTVEKVSEATKVSEKHIRALEAGELGELPGGVFRRGFVRSYLGAVGLDEAEWMERFESICRDSGLRTDSSSDWTTFAENVKNSRASHPHPVARRTGWGLLLVLLGVSLWCGFRWMTHRPLLPWPRQVLHSRFGPARPPSS